MHDLRRLIRERMDEAGMNQADLARASGLSKQLISKLLSDDRDQLDEMPARATIAGLARAFGLSTEAVMLVAARAYGIPVDEPAVIASTDGVPSTQLAGELLRRLQRQESDEHGRQSSPNVRALPPRPSPVGRAARKHHDE